jgi:uncharacterized protein YjbI with pentapeptide repeats
MHNIAFYSHLGIIIKKLRTFNGGIRAKHGLYRLYEDEGDDETWHHEFLIKNNLCIIQILFQNSIVSTCEYSNICFTEVSFHTNTNIVQFTAHLNMSSVI